MTHFTIAAAGLLLLAHSHGFELRTGYATTSSCALHMTTPEGPAGSFFHQVPGESDGEKERSDSAPDDINDEVVELLRQRRKPPRASKPSTINGIPTHKTTGESLLLHGREILVFFRCSS
jgi:hypothetical protein